MSATNRSATTRIAHDNYPTPSWCVRRLLEACHLPSGVWLEPCAGDGAIIRAVKNAPDRRRPKPEIEWRANELRPECWNAICELTSVQDPSIGSYLDTDFSGADVIITNPPFNLAFEVMQKAVREAPVVALLLRLNVLGSGRKSGRSAWLRANTPDVYVLPNRPSFTGRGTDATEYAWMVWRTPRHDPWLQPEIQILAETPLAERHLG